MPLDLQTRRENQRRHAAKWKREHPEQYAAAWKAYRARNKETMRARTKADYHANKEARLSKQSETRHGITSAEKATMLADQGGICCICDSPTPNGKGWHTDHNHKTGKVRGILCHNCNTGLGQFKDDPALMRLAADYLEKRG